MVGKGFEPLIVIVVKCNKNEDSRKDANYVFAIQEKGLQALLLEIRAAAVNHLVGRRFFAREMVRISYADRYKDLGIRVPVVPLERFFSEPVKVETERQVLEVFLPYEIVILGPKLVRVAFLQGDDLCMDPGAWHLKLFILLVLEVFVPADFFLPVFPPEKPDGDEFAVLSGEFGQEGGHLADVRVPEDPVGLVRQPEDGHGAVLVGVLVPRHSADVGDFVGVSDLVVFYGLVRPQVLDVGITDGDERDVPSDSADEFVAQRVMPSGG